MSRLVRIFTVAALGLSVAVPPVAVPKAAYAAPRPAPLDGEPTPAACAPLGFELTPETPRPQPRPSYAAPAAVTASASRVGPRTQRAAASPSSGASATAGSARAHAAASDRFGRDGNRRDRVAHPARP
jgi:hypothetical protein